MATVLINDEYLTDIAVAIRNKNNSETLYKPKEMAAAIDAITGGGAEPAVIEALTITANGTYTAPEGVDGYSPITVEVASVSGDLPPEAFIIKDDCTNRLAYNGWNWYVDLYGNQITSKDISSLHNFAYGSTTLTQIPFDLNITSDCNRYTGAFYNCYRLTEAPRIVGQLAIPTTSYKGYSDIDSLFSNCRAIREIPYDYFHTFGGVDYWTSDKIRLATSGCRGNIFQNCYSLRALPDINILKNKYAYYNCLYYSMCTACHSLGEIRDLVVLDEAAYTSNMFVNIVSRCRRLQAFTFETNEDGSPKIAQWKNQTLDLSYEVGYSSSGAYSIMIGYGNSEDKHVGSVEEYEALKNDPDWWTIDPYFSRYNKASAIETINSLPDVSAYGTNTIKFKTGDGSVGANTDGGAIADLTEEEIAVAAAKGWTVSLVN